MKRLLTELSTLQSALPEGIFVRHGMSRLDVMKIIIVGPKDTPYEGGLFEFDLFCPMDYPQRPPMMTFKTTGKGMAHFNPNLYNDGKVCLSLLGTWSGPSWIPNESTLLQILVSIQSMVFCDEPWYNEPGRESRRAEDQSKRYNLEIQSLTVPYAMTDWLKMTLDKSSGGKDNVWQPIIEKYFEFHGERVLSIIKEWETKSANVPDHRRHPRHYHHDLTASAHWVHSHLPSGYSDHLLPIPVTQKVMKTDAKVSDAKKEYVDLTESDSELETKLFGAKPNPSPLPPPPPLSQSNPEPVKPKSWAQIASTKVPKDVSSSFESPQTKKGSLEKPQAASQPSKPGISTTANLAGQVQSPDATISMLPATFAKPGVHSGLMSKIGPIFGFTKAGSDTGPSKHDYDDSLESMYGHYLSDPATISPIAKQNSIKAQQDYAKALYMHQQHTHLAPPPPPPPAYSPGPFGLHSQPPAQTSLKGALKPGSHVPIYSGIPPAAWNGKPPTMPPPFHNHIALTHHYASTMNMERDDEELLAKMKAKKKHGASGNGPPGPPAGPLLSPFYGYPGAPGIVSGPPGGPPSAVPHEVAYMEDDVGLYSDEDGMGMPSTLGGNPFSTRGRIGTLKQSVEEYSKTLLEFLGEAEQVKQMV